MNNIQIKDELEKKFGVQSPIHKPKTSKLSLFANNPDLPNNQTLNNSSLYGLQKVFFDETNGIDGIDVVLTTPYEKVLKILERVKNSLISLNQPKETITEINWVIKRIQNNDYYNFDFDDRTVIDFEKYCEESNEVKTFFDILNEHSEGNQRRNKKKFGTAKINNEENKKKFTLEIKQLTSKLRQFEKNKSMIVETSIQGDNNISKVDFSFLKKGNIDLENCFSHEFNIFDAEAEVGESNILPILAKNIITTLNLNEIINNENLNEFLVATNKGYKKNPYHKALHGVDVMHTLSMFIVHSNLIESIYLSKLDILSIVISGLLHDIGHPGLNNNFQINSQSELALIYNDKSVLENYHISESSKLLRKPTCNILTTLSEPEAKIFRKRLIESILSTDMVFHAKCQATMKERVTNAKKNECDIVDKNADNFIEQQQECINFLVHSADISHSTKRFEISYKWSMFLMDEFWNQGDIEKMKGLPVSFLCDRTTAEVPKSQIGFIRGLIVPLFDVCIEFLPELSYLRKNIDDNLIQWNDLIGKDREENFLDKINNLKEKLKVDRSDIFEKINEVEKSQNVGNIFNFSVDRTNKIDQTESIIDFGSRFDIEVDKKEDLEIERKINLDNSH